MTKVKDDNVLVESRNAREKVLGSERKWEVFEKVKEISLLGKDEVVLVDGLAEYYEVPKSTIESLIEDNRDEFEEGGLTVFNKQQLKKFKGSTLKECNLYEDYKYARQLMVINRESILRTGMLLRDSKVAKTIRDYLLNVESISTKEQRKWAIERALGKQKRRQLTDALKDSGEDERMKGFAYSTYTNMIYKLVLGMSAKKYKKMNNIDDNLRNNLNKKQLEIIKKLEDLAKIQLDLGFEYSEAKEMIKINYKKYENKVLLEG